MTRMTPVRIVSLMVMMAAILWGAGCIKLDATLTLNRAGGGTLRAMYGMPAFLVRQLEVTRQWTHSLEVAEGHTNSLSQAELDIPMVYDEAVLKTRFKRMESDGLVLDALRTRDQGGWKYVDFTVKFDRLESLLRQSWFRDCGASLKHTDDENCKLTIVPPGLGSGGALAALSSPDAMAKLTPFLNGLRVVVRVDLPGEVRNSTSTMSDVRRATWEWDFDKDAHVMDRLAQEKIIVVFDGAQARLRDFDKPAGSTLLLPK